MSATPWDSTRLDSTPSDSTPSDSAPSPSPAGATTLEPAPTEAPPGRRRRRGDRRDVSERPGEPDHADQPDHADEPDHADQDDSEHLDDTGRHDPEAATDKSPRRWVPYAGAGSAYLVLGIVLWWHAWSAGATTHTLCGCGDPALFLWFFQWPATAIAHAQNPFFSTALFHPTGVNLLSQTSVTALSIPLVPITWIWGPVASLNVASTLVPALTALAAFAAIRRFAPWTPAAFLGGLLYGFSPFVLTSLQFAHLMTAALMLLPLILIALDEILVRQRHQAWTSGVTLGLLVFVQFFISTEVLAIVVLLGALSILFLVGAALLIDPDEVWRRAPHALTALAVGSGVGVVLLAWPVWFALAGPAHLSGAIWPDINILGGNVGSNFISTNRPPASSVAAAFNGYEGLTLGSGSYLGWGLLAVLFGGLVAFFRDLRLWFFGLVLTVCTLGSLGLRTGKLDVITILSKVPVLDNVIVQRFMAVGFLAAAVMLGLILDHVSRLGPAVRRLAHGVSGLAPRLGRLTHRGPEVGKVLAWLAAAAVAAVALLPMALTYGSRLPFTMQTVVLPRWYTRVAPKLPSNQVLLSYPAPFSGIASAMSWQAVNRMHYSQAGGGGPQGTASRAGPARWGVTVLSGLVGLDTPVPTGTGAERDAVVQALRYWQVTTVVIATNQSAPLIQQGPDPAYAAAFMTATLGALPKLEAGAWVWYGVKSDLRPSSQSGSHGTLGWPVQLRTLAGCVARAEGFAGRLAAPTLRAPDCVELASAVLRSQESALKALRPGRSTASAPGSPLGSG